MAALFAEIEGKSGKYRDRRVVSVFIGGGTPSRLTGEQMGQLMACIRRHFFLDPAAEITTEVNPGTVSEEKLRTFRKAGINRLSIGMQSAQDEELRELGRIHDFAGFLEAYEAAVQAGYTNINVDVMSGLPGQTLESLRDTLGKLLALRPMPQHVSAYSLIVEEGTPLRGWRSGENYSCRRKIRSGQCMRRPGRYWQNMAFIVMRYPIMPGMGMSAFIMSVTGSAGIIWALALARHRWLIM